MMIIYGHRSYGRVHGHRGEYAQTQFAHLYYLPLIPMTSVWVTGGNRGFHVDLNARSVIATYLRWWGLAFAALALVLSPDLVGAAIAAPLVIAVALAWSWRSIRGARAIRQSDGDRAVFGTRCPPAMMTADMRQDLRRRLDERWSKLGGGRSPEDVVSFGPRTPEEGLFAYGLLRLAAVEHRDRAAAEAADKLLAGIEREPTTGSPYRGDAGVAFVPLDEEAHDDVPKAAAPEAATEWNERTLCNFGACVGVIGPDGACKTCGKRPGVDVETPLPPPPPKTWWMRPISAGARVALIGAVIWSIGLTWAGGASLLPTIKADSAFLAKESRTSRYVEVVCDDLSLAGTFSDGAKMYACRTGDRVVPVLGAVDSTAAGTTLVGQLRDYTGEYKWPAYVVASSSTSAGYLRAHGRGLRILNQLAGVAGLAGFVALLVAIVIVRRRRARLTIKRGS